jgi:hypothetical protein
MVMPWFALSMVVHSAANLVEDLGLIARSNNTAFLSSSMEGLS